jgi:hypothetical protein
MEPKHRSALDPLWLNSSHWAYVLALLGMIKFRNNWVSPVWFLVCLLICDNMNTAETLSMKGFDALGV